MRNALLGLRRSLGIVSLLAIAPIVSSRNAAAAPVAPDPVTEIRWWNYFPADSWQSIRFTVPDQDTTQPANDDTRRRYDAHIARMFAITNFLCQRSVPSLWQHKPLSGGITWNYEAANGNIAMGQFKMSCLLAHQLATAYGAGPVIPTEIRRTFNQPDGPPTLTTTRYPVPSLGITGTKVPKWLAFVQRVKPVNRPQATDQSFPVQTILKSLKDQTQVPILLPDRSFLADPVQGGIDVEAKPDRYVVDIYTVPNCRAGACYSGSLSATPGTALFTPEASLPSDTFRHIQLANGVTGVFFNGCGAYCTAFVEWQMQGVLYRITAKNGNQPDLVHMADAAIVAGPR